MLAISCPSRTLCLAFNDAGRVFVSQNPAAGGRSFHKVRGLDIPTNLGFSTSLQLFNVACPSTHLCLTATHGTLVYTTNPTGGASAWHRDTLDPSVDNHIDSIACRTAHFCVALDNNTGGGSIGASAMTFTSANPAGGATAWVAGAPLQNVNSAGLSCLSTGFCVVGTDSSIEWISNVSDPMATWQFMMGSGPGAIDSVSCPSARLCLAVPHYIRNDLVSTNPAAGSWRQTPGGTGYLTCAATTLCVGTAYPGIAVWASTNPAGGRSAWHFTHIARGRNFLRSVSCSSTRLCVAVGDSGSVAVGQARH